ncbi:MAG: response regulator [bacterium]|nr:response regulator [bacterium]
MSIEHLRIIVVDDSLGIRLLARKIFQSLGYSDVEVVEDGFLALDRMQEEPFDLAVIDWSMPKMSGLELLEAIRANPALAEIPVLLVTGEEEPDEMMEALKAGADSYMTKPYDAPMLVERIERIFEFRQAKALRPPTPDF